MISTTQMSLLSGEDRVVGSRPDDDYYATPAWLARALVDRALRRTRDVSSVLDAGAGLGVLAEAAEEALADRRADLQISAVELDERRCRAMRARHRWDVVCGDIFAFAGAVQARWDLVVTNPPFRRWQEWISACKRLLVPSRGILAAIGFVNVLGGQSRSAWWRSDPPTQVHIVSRRPSYTGGATDPRDTVLVIWERGWERLALDWVEP